MGTLAGLAVIHQTGIDQYFQMLRYGRLRQIKRCDNILAAGGVQPGQLPDNAQARGMGERGENPRRFRI